MQFSQFRPHILSNDSKAVNSGVPRPRWQKNPPYLHSKQKGFLHPFALMRCKEYADKNRSTQNLSVSQIFL